MCVSICKLKRETSIFPKLLKHANAKCLFAKKERERNKIRCWKLVLEFLATVFCKMHGLQLSFLWEFEIYCMQMPVYTYRNNLQTLRKTRSIYSIPDTVYFYIGAKSTRSLTLKNHQRLGRCKSIFFVKTSDQVERASDIVSRATTKKNRDPWSRLIDSRARSSFAIWPPELVPSICECLVLEGILLSELHSCEPRVVSARRNLN